MDRWSLVHAASGYALAWYGVTPAKAWLLLCSFEVFEAFLRSAGTDGRGLTEYESQANIVADVLCGMAGYYARRA